MNICDRCLQRAKKDYEILKKKITHEEAKKRFDKLQEIILITFSLDEYLGDCNIVQAYFKQQEKVSKLIELYRLKDDLIEEYQVTDGILERQQTLSAISGVRKEIQGIEEELK